MRWVQKVRTLLPIEQLTATRTNFFNGGANKIHLCGVVGSLDMYDKTIYSPEGMECVICRYSRQPVILYCMIQSNVGCLGLHDCRSPAGSTNVDRWLRSPPLQIFYMKCFWLHFVSSGGFERSTLRNGILSRHPNSRMWQMSAYLDEFSFIMFYVIIKIVAAFG